MPVTMFASSACTHSGSAAARRASSFTANGHAAAERGDLRDLLAVGPGEPSLDQPRHAVLVERPQLDHGRRVAVDQAVARLGQRGAHRRRPVAEHDADALRGGRAGEVVEEAQARVVGVVDVVDGEQEAVRRRREAHELGDRDEQALVGAASRPGHLGAGEGPVDLLPMMVGEAVEQRRVSGDMSASASTTGA